METTLGLLITVGGFAALIGHWLTELRQFARQELPAEHRPR